MKGSIIHEMDEAYTDGKSWEDVLDRYQREYDKLFLEEKEEYGDIISDMKRIMEGYISKWSADDLKYIKKKDKRTEHLLEVDLIPGKVVLVGKIDKIGVDKMGRVWLVEKKSFKKLPKEEVRFSDLQTTIYYWAAPQCGFPIPDGIMWDYVRSKPPAIPPLLKNGQLSKRMGIDTTFSTYLDEVCKLGLSPDYYSEILQHLKEKPDNFYRRIFLPAPDSLVVTLIKDLKETALEIRALGETRSRNLSRDCSWCGYYPLCQAELRGLDAKFIRSREYKERSDEVDEAPIEESGD